VPLRQREEVQEVLLSDGRQRALKVQDLQSCKPDTENRLQRYRLKE
jgi:hypothetical protein